MTTEPQGALAGIRVLDFSRVLAGPFCTMQMGDMGAEIIKVENPDQGDDTRQLGPPWAGEGDTAMSAYYLSVNRNKRSLTLNLKHPEGQAIARRLAAKSHVVIENMKPGSMTRFGLGYDDLREVNPALVYCSITGFGQTGPYRSRPGYDYTIQAMGGLMSVTGPADGEPYKVGVAISDVLTGFYALTSILAALRHAEHTGEGQYIDVSLLDSQIAALVNVASNYLVSGKPPARYGNEHANIVPYQMFKASDGEFIVAVANDRQFTLLCEVIERPDLRDDPRYATNPGRVEYREELIAELGRVFALGTVAKWVSGLLDVGVPAGEINDIPAILRDPHVQSRGLVQALILPNGENFRFIGPPVRFSGTPARVQLPPPLLGQHTEEVLREILGLDQETIARYREQGVIT